MGKEFSDVLIAVGSILSALAATIAVIVSWNVYKGQRLLSQRQLLIPLWQYMTTIRNLNIENPATPQILNAANTLELIAVCVEGQMVDPAVIKRTFRDVYISIYEQIIAIQTIPMMFNKEGRPLSGARLLGDYPAASKFYKSLIQERENRDIPQ